MFWRDVAFVECFFLLLLLNIDTSLSPPSVSLYTKPAELRTLEQVLKSTDPGPMGKPVQAELTPPVSASPVCSSFVF